MTTTAIVMMLVILAILWGGFAFMLRLALKKEAAKSKS